MLDAHYVDDRLVRTYDPLCPPDADTDFYERLAAPPARSVLDLGCGTGRLALQLARAGHRVTGVDPAVRMLEVARQNDLDGRVEWLEGDARSFSLDSTFDLVVMTGHAFQVFHEDAEVASVLEGARRHLRPGGTLAFETRNPSAREWERWVAANRRTVEVDGLGELTYWSQFTEVSGEFVSFEQTYRFLATGEEFVAASTLRFMDEPTLRTHLDAAGFRRVAIYGDWDRSPVTPSSLELIVVAQP